MLTAMCNLLTTRVVWLEVIVLLVT